MTVSIIIVNYKTPAVLKDCVESVFQFEKENTFEIIIVDNHSRDGSEEVIKRLAEKHENVKAVYLKSKISFSAANNKGFDESKGEFILIMNPDIIFTEPLLKKLTDNLIHLANTGAVCPRLNGTDGKFQYRYFQRYPSVIQFILFYSFAAKLFENFGYLKNRYLCNYEIDLNSGKAEKTDQIPCAFYFTRKDIFEESGEMNETYELFFEDVDLSYRTSKKYDLKVDTSISVTHLGGESFKSGDDHWLHGRFIMSMIKFFENNYGAIRTLLLKVCVYANSLIVISGEYLKGLAGKKNSYRLKKHKYLISEFNKKFF
ncbi:MAG: glycosyltransferase [Ignavibacteria bacterium]|nr:glycosyltransferase [Ignavibacteria bacterium]